MSLASWTLFTLFTLFTLSTLFDKKEEILIVFISQYCEGDIVDWYPHHT